MNSNYSVKLYLDRITYTKLKLSVLSLFVTCYLVGRQPPMPKSPGAGRVSAILADSHTKVDTFTHTFCKIQYGGTSQRPFPLLRVGICG